MSMWDDMKGEKKSFASRPNCFGFDLHSAASSGYASAEASTEYEHPPFDWTDLQGKLEDLNLKHHDDDGDFDLSIINKLTYDTFELDVCDSEDKAQVTLHTDEPVQYVQTDCHFTVEVNREVSAFDDEDEGIQGIDDFEAHVMGPSGFRYNVIRTAPKKSESRIISRQISQVKCSFRPFECGPHTCYIRMDSKRAHPVQPLTINISRKYQTVRPIVTGDIELSNANQDKMEARKPWGLCSNTKTEQVIVADREKHEIIILTTDGEIDFTFGKEGTGPGEFFRPTAVAYDATRDRILVADKDNHRIQVFSPEGKFISMFGRKGHYNGQFFFPWGLAVSKDGEFIAVADSRNHRVQLFTGDGHFLRKFSLADRNSSRSNGASFGQSYKQEFDYPRGICFDNAGENLYVTDFNLHTLLEIDINFTSYRKVLTHEDLKRPQGVAVDAVGNILVCDSKHNTIKVLSPEGKIIKDIDKIGSSKIELPLDISVMKGGFIAVLDMNGRVRVF